MKNHKLKLFICMMLFMLAVSVTSLKVEAADQSKKGIGFSVATQFNSQQIDPNSPYFYLLMEPGKEQTVKVKIKSTRKEPIEVKMSILNGVTSDKVSIGYAKEEKVKKDKTLKNAVDEMIELPVDKVTVANMEEKVVEIKIKPFKEGFEGVRLGAIDFMGTEKNQKASVEVGKGYQIGIILASNGEQFNNGKTFELRSVTAGLVNGQPAILPKFQNPTPYTIENLKIKATVLDKKGGKKLKEKEITGGAIAPNTSFQMPIEWGLSELKSGKYHFSMTAKNVFYDWKFEKDFEVSAKQARDIGENSTFKVVTPKWIQIITIVQGGLLIVLLVFLVIRRKKFVKKYKEIQKSKRKKGRKGAKRK